MFRLARRHRDIGEDDTPLPPDVMRRRLIAAAIVAAMIIAAVVGVVLASPGTPVHHGPTRAQIRAAQQRAAAVREKAAATAAANKQIDGILTSLVLTRNRNRTRLLNDGTPTKQIRDAVAVQKAYVAAVHKVTPLEPKTTSAAPLATTMTKIADDYGRLISAGRANKPATWTRVFDTIERDEATLRARSPSSRRPDPQWLRGSTRCGGVWRGSYPGPLFGPIDPGDTAGASCPTALPNQYGGCFT